MNSENLFDTIETENQVFTGVIDYISKRHVVIYDMTMSNEPLFRLIAIKWKLHFYDIRFSIFKQMYFPNANMPDPIVVNASSIVSCTRDLEITKPKRHKQRVTIE